MKGNAINIGNMFTSLGISDSSEYYYHYAFQLEKAGIEPFGTALRGNYARFLIKSKRLNEAIPIYKELLRDAKKKAIDEYSILIFQMNLGDAYMLNNQPDSAIIHLLNARQISFNYPGYSIDIIRSIADYYSSKKDYKRAYQMLKELDDLVILEKNRQVPLFSEKLHLEYQEKIHASELQLQQEEIRNERSKTIRLYIFFGISLLFIIILIVLYILIQNKNNLLVTKNI
jgi:tetratricopeptide (TPR) repeat protein